MEPISQRGLNRATLARQLLLERGSMPAADAITHLVGMQAQAPLAPYVGLWTRLADFDQGELSALTEQRAVVRVPLMRATVHLVTAADCLGLHPLHAPLHARTFNSQAFARNIAGVDRDELLATGRSLLEEQPRTRAELGKLLAERWPERDPASLAYAVTYLLPVAQVPPRAAGAAAAGGGRGRRQRTTGWVVAGRVGGQPE